MLVNIEIIVYKTLKVLMEFTSFFPDTRITDSNVSEDVLPPSPVIRPINDPDDNISVLELSSNSSFCSSLSVVTLDDETILEYIRYFFLTKYKQQKKIWLLQTTRLGLDEFIKKLGREEKEEWEDKKEE